MSEQWSGEPTVEYRDDLDRPYTPAEFREANSGPGAGNYGPGQPLPRMATPEMERKLGKAMGFPEYQDPDPVATQPVEPDRVELFRVSDDPADIFYAPARVGPNVGIRYMRELRKHGQDYAIAGLMEAVLGEDGFAALAEYDDLTEDQLKQIQDVIQKHVFGKDQGKAGRAPAR